MLTERTIPCYSFSFVVLGKKYSQIAQVGELRNLQIAHNCGSDPQIAQTICRLSTQSAIRRLCSAICRLRKSTDCVEHQYFLETKNLTYWGWECEPCTFSPKNVDAWKWKCKLERLQCVIDLVFRMLMFVSFGNGSGGRGGIMEEWRVFVCKKILAFMDDPKTKFMAQEWACNRA